MIYYIGELLSSWGPSRLLQSNAVLIAIALFLGFFLSKVIIPKFYKVLPSDRGREFTLTKEASKGKPTGSGVVFITIFVILSFLILPFSKDSTYIMYMGMIILTWFMMLTGYLDDRSTNPWGEYIKALMDLVICVSASTLICWGLSKNSSAVNFAYLQPADLEKFNFREGEIYFWLPFVKNPIHVLKPVFVIISTIMLWISVNTTNCTDGVDGLSSTLVLVALIILGAVFYTILGHTDIAKYLKVPHIVQGANWAIVIFCLAGVLMGYLWHNAFPSSVLMGDAGSRALGFFIGISVMLSGNPLMFLATSSIIFVNGGMGLLKVALKRFFHINIFKDVRFPLHDHMRKNRGWSPTQVLIKFVIVQLLISGGILGIFFKLR